MTDSDVEVECHLGEAGFESEPEGVSYFEDLYSLSLVTVKRIVQCDREHDSLSPSLGTCILST